MSYDVSIHYKDSDHCLWWRNHTSNTSGMWRLAGCNLADYHGWTTDDILPLVSGAINEMQRMPDTYRQLEPTNGWGTFESTVEFLQDIESACKLFTGEKVSVWT